MYQAYPKWIPMDNTDPDHPKKQRLVKSEDEHKKHNLQHYEEEKAAIPATPVSNSDAISQERERCAMVAERFPDGADVARAIRTVPPTMKEVQEAGYDGPTAKAIVGEETRKSNAGEFPYGPAPTTSEDPKPVPAAILSAGQPLPQATA